MCGQRRRETFDTSLPSSFERMKKREVGKRRYEERSWRTGVLSRDYWVEMSLMLIGGLTIKATAARDVTQQSPWGWRCHVA